MTNSLRKTIFRCVVTTLALTPFLFGASSASAQQAAEDASHTLDEIIVTAQKREQNLQNVGISITALDTKALAEAGIRDVSRLSLVVPGMMYSFYGVDSKIAIRGAHSNNTYGDNQSIAGFFIDGVYRPRPSQQSQGYFDVERIEVLKGPQGTLYGRNTFAGAINLYTNKPDTEANSGWLEAGYGDYSAFTLEGFYNFAVNDDFALRFAVQTKDSDGYIANSGTGEDIGSSEERNFRVSALWTPGDNAEILLRYTSIDLAGNLPGIFAAEGICRPINASGATDAFGTMLDCSNNVGADNPADFMTPYTVTYDHTPQRDYTEDNVTLDISWEMSDSWDARIITSYTDFVSELSSDGDFSDTPGYPYYFDEVMESTTFEFNATYAGDGPVSATLGLYWSDDQFGFGYSEDPHGAFSYCESISCFGPDLGPAFDFGPGLANFYADFQDIKITTQSVFAQVEFAVSDSVRLIAGVRSNDEEKDTKSFVNFSYFGGAGTGQFDAAANPLPGVNPSMPHDLLPGFRPRDVLVYDIRPAATLMHKFDIVTWKAGLEWDVNDDAMLYANAATGYLSGGVNGDGTEFGQQENLAYEVGLKSRWAEDTVQFNMAVYRNEGTDLTTQRAELVGGIFITSTVNGGEVITNGAEVELDWLPTDQWTVSAALSLMDSEHTDFGINNGWEEANGVVLVDPIISLNGTAPPWAPDLTLSLAVSYDIELGNGGLLTPFLQVYYSDEYNTDDLVTYFTQVQDSYTKTDFRLFWTSAEGKFAAEAYVENIEDEAVLGRTNIGSGINQTSYLFPRNYGVRFSVRF